MPGSRNGNARSRRSAFTLIEILVVVAIIALLISILLPSLARAKEMSRRAVCASRLHNIGLAVTTYGVDNKGKIIQCHSSGAGIPDTQIAISPRRSTPSKLGTNPDHLLVDWQGAAKKYKLDKITWECPNREGIFAYEGNPDPSVQGYTAESLRSQGYMVYDQLSYNQWIIGFQYFGGMQEWRTTFPSSTSVYKARSPVDMNSPGHWALAADANIMVDGYWGGGVRRAYEKIPPHPNRDGWPEGGNVLTLDGAAAWIHESRMWMLNDWHSNRTRLAFWWQSDLGEFGKAIRAYNLQPGIRRIIKQYGQTG
ncbi:MAG TPA: prepilin-type N-terminal cleavage/methylation domain-containing protein [Phycisphaerae bacterium]|nr:prepilin-type N-terminal cleavage/methylation domain-containing protein [Phycisphaerae bacterium]HOJ74985.1 prepilin-type N-terminal cleavage/methylation domain-containing protein [Phycisphaerae bacterium]HOM51546.1 prepilin-type N-terminal cleavage/methylation domain-containing protein [Phycisphaerae bacterium]HON68893.1 prepilin-type N-terminal cleavage/methylation domain-containing protein [Phycisphaerae bacterium]HOQ85458.1 prepilin-type N-terminal cleavage/methylation domain-containing 